MMNKRVNRFIIMTIISILTLNISVQAATSDTPTSMEKQQYRKSNQTNHDIDKFVVTAYELVRSGKEYMLPHEHAESENIGRYDYEKGYKEYQMKKKKHLKIALTGAGLLFIAWLCRRFYVARKMIS